MFNFYEDDEPIALTKEEFEILEKAHQLIGKIYSNSSNRLQTNIMLEALNAIENAQDYFFEV